VTELARNVLAARSSDALRATQIVACGPEPMLRAAAKLSASLGLPCQVALEEFMACGVGGCAGCTVLVRTPTGDAMKKVCVDGPVFDAATVYGLM
jgi:dihydroorotate dehydrogenase electron transfer subunit